jgi:hypothetical protein
MKTITYSEITPTTELWDAIDKETKLVYLRAEDQAKPVCINLETLNIAN